MQELGEIDLQCVFLFVCFRQGLSQHFVFAGTPAVATSIAQGNASASKPSASKVNAQTMNMRQRSHSGENKRRREKEKLQAPKRVGLGEI